MTSFLTRTARTEIASEFTRHGLARRLSTIKHASIRIFEILPPDADSPQKNELRDVTIYLQGFLINVYGALDNLARIWCLEAEPKNSKGKPIPNGQIGLGPKNTYVRESLSADLREYLSGMDGWFGYLEDYRHALAHRVPLYIPPKQLNDADGEEWNRLEDELSKAVQDRDFDRWDALFAEQAALGKFEPVMMHSYGEGARPVLFHSQLVCDLATVVEIGEKMLSELKALS